MRYLVVLLAAAAAVLLASCAAPGEEQEFPGLVQTGVYQGLSEGGLLEVQVHEGVYKVFTLQQEAKGALKALALQKGDGVKILYGQDDRGRLEALCIEREATETENIRTVTGVYVGQADVNFFEVRVGDGKKQAFMVFMITDAVRETFETLGLKNGDVVRIRYAESEAGQLLVRHIEKIGQ